MDAVYTHGHHESVLRSHRWRTAENSAAYLLPHLKPGMSAARRGQRARHHHRRPGRAGWRRVTASEVTRAGAGAGQHRERGRAAWTTSTSPSRDVHALDFPDDTFDVVHAHQVLQHVGDPVQALREMRRVSQAGRARGGARQRLRRLHLVPGAAGAGRVAGALPADGARQRRRAGRRAAPAVVGPRGRVRPTSPPPRPPGASPRRRTGPGGAGCGRTASRSAMAAQALATGAATEDDLRRISGAGWSGPRRTTAGCRSSRRDPLPHLTRQTPPVRASAGAPSRRRAPASSADGRVRR